MRNNMVYVGGGKMGYGGQDRTCGWGNDMNMTNTEHQRSIDAFESKQIMLERQDAAELRELCSHEREVEEANNSCLFNIPSNTWRRRWKALQDPNEDKRTAKFFWLGVFCSCSHENYEEAYLLYYIAELLTR